MHQNTNNSAGTYDTSYKHGSRTRHSLLEVRKAGAAAPEVLLLGHFLSQLFFTRQNLLHVLLPLFLLTTSITTILPLDVNADSINHFDSAWNDVRNALSKGRLKKSLLTLFRFHRYLRHHGWQSTSGGPERSETRTYIAVFLRRDEYERA